MLTTLLLRHRNEIASTWAGRLNLFPGRYRECGYDETLEWCTSAIDAILRSREAGSDDLLRAHATAIAGQREARGFEIDEVIEGLLLLTEMALPFIHADCGMQGEEALAAMMELDASVRLMASQFARLFAASKRRTVEQVAVLEERARLARDLHDSLSQSLYGVGMCAEAAARLLASGDTEAAAAHLRDVRDSAGEALREMRFLVFELRPSILQEDGLVEALTARLSAVEKRVGVSAELDAEGMGRLPSAVEEAFYGIAREALNNSLRHAHATRLTIRLRRRAETAVMEIGDNGVGFEVDPGWGRGGMGLRGMRERAERVAASFDVCSRPGQGTTIRVAARLDGARLQKPAGGKGPQAI